MCLLPSCGIQPLIQLYIGSSSAGDEDTDTMSKVSLGSSSSSVHSGHSGPYSLDLDTIAGDSEEPCLSGTWEHDIQEQYVSEGSVLAAWDNSMKSVLCFGEDYSNYIRRKSELPSLDIISNDICGLQVSAERRSAGCCGRHSTVTNSTPLNCFHGKPFYANVSLSFNFLYGKNAEPTGDQDQDH